MEYRQSTIQSTYNAAADLYDDPANAYWARCGLNTVERLGLEDGSEVLDVACGTGASALSAARAVGPEGSVLAVDLADQMLARARSKADRAGLQNIEFRRADMTKLGVPDERFDAVICVFGIFFAPDMERMVKRLWRMLRPNGRLAITTWGTNLFEPMYTVFDDAVRNQRPDLVTDLRPWDRLTDPSDLEDLLETCGPASLEVVAEDAHQRLAAPESWWRIVLGSGLRSIVEAMDAQAVNRLYATTVAFAREHGIKSVSTNVNYAIASKERCSVG